MKTLMTIVLGIMLVGCFDGKNGDGDSDELSETNYIAKQGYCHKILKISLIDESIDEIEEVSDKSGESDENKNHKGDSDSDKAMPKEIFLDVTYAMTEDAHGNQWVECSVSDGARVYTQTEHIKSAQATYGRAECAIIYDLYGHSFSELVFTWEGKNWAWIWYIDNDGDKDFSAKFGSRDCVAL